jgi:hypothetical protein
MRGVVSVRAPGLAAERLRRVLLECGIEEIRVLRDGLDIALHHAPDALRGVAATIGAWAADGGEPVTLHLDGERLRVTGLLNDAQRRAVDRWIARRQ